jgi:hypothetical protein
MIVPVPSMSKLDIPEHLQHFVSNCDRYASVERLPSMPVREAFIPQKKSGKFTSRLFVIFSPVFQIRIGFNADPGAFHHSADPDPVSKTHAEPSHPGRTLLSQKV